MILLGIVFLALGILMVVFAQNIWNFTGNIPTVENLFAGSTKGFIQLCGIALILLGMLFATGLAGWLTAPIADTLRSLTGN